MNNHLTLFFNTLGRFDRRDNRRSGDFDRKTTMHSAVCDACGKECKVPFKPTGDKPIYCSNCFEKQGGNNSNRRSSQDREMYSAICDECGNECKVPFKPSSDKPIYCSRCFENKGNTHDGAKKSDNNKQSEQLNLIISKLDLILVALENQNKPPKKTIRKLLPKKETAEKVVTKKKAVKKTKKE